MSDSQSLTPELEAIRKSTPYLETALKMLNRGLVYFLEEEGFISDDVCEKVLNPRTPLSEVERAGELVTRIRDRVKIDSRSFHQLVDRLKQDGATFEPIVKKLEAEYDAACNAAAAAEACQQHSSSHPTNQLHQEDSGIV